MWSTYYLFVIVLSVYRSWGTEIAFTSELSQDASFELKSNILFDEIKLNIENSYDPKTGYFKAPIGGIYVFTTDVMNENPSGPVYGIIRKNGLNVCPAYAQGNQHNTGCCTFVLELHPGDQISVTAEDNTYNSGYTRFSGYLLSHISIDTSFTAAVSVNSVFSEGTNLIFDNVVTNIGSAYDSTTGIFTVFEDGVYWFTVNIMNVDAVTHGYLYKNNEVKLCSAYSTTPGYMTGSCSAVLFLEKGNTISVKSDLGLQNTFNKDFTRFMGALIPKAEVAFTAFLSNDSVFGYGSNIIYDNVIFNLGNGYDAVNGVFTVPADGEYFFTVNTMNDLQDQNAYGFLTVNGISMCSAYSNFMIHSTGTCSIILQLKTGDIVYVASSYEEDEEYNESFNSFMGYLIPESIDIL